MDKNIWILHHYATPPSMSGLTRPYEFSKQFKKYGYKATVFSSAYLHYTGENLISDKKKYILYSYEGSPFIFVRSSVYKNNGISRVYNMLMFFYNLLSVSKSLLKTIEKPDIIYASSPHPLTLIAGILLGKRLQIPCICEVRDLWPENFVVYGVIGKSNPILRLLYAGEKWIYKNADKLIFTMEGGKDYIIEKGWDVKNGGPIDLLKVHHVNNGVDLQAFDYNRENFQLKDEDLDDKNTFKVVYTGSIRKVNKVETLIDVAQKLKDENVKILIWGSGDQVQQIEKRIKSEGINNLILKGRVEKKYIPYITSKADLNIISGTNNPLYKYGVSKNKMFDYFASGKPVLSTASYKYSLIDRYDAGSELENSSIESIASEILKYKSLNQQEYEKYCANARRAANDYSFQELTKKLIQILEN